MFQRSVVAAASACAILLAAITGSAAAGQQPNERDGFFLGLNIGGGSAGLDDSGGDSDREGGLAGNFRLGYAFQNQFGLSLEGNGWTKEVEGGTWTFSVGGLGFTFWPAGSGFHVRGVIGSGSVSYETDLGDVRVTTSESGFGLSGGIGYEMRLAKSFAIGPQIDYSYADVSDDLSVNFVNFTVGANWYF